MAFQALSVCQSLPILLCSKDAHATLCSLLTAKILHRPTFDTKLAIAPLLLNLVAIGSLFYGTKAARARGQVLWSLAHKGVASAVSLAGLLLQVLLTLILSVNQSMSVGKAYTAQRRIRSYRRRSTRSYGLDGPDICQFVWRQRFESY